MTGWLQLTTSLICLSSEDWSKKLSGALCILFVCFPFFAPQVVLVTHFSNFPWCCYKALHIALMYMSIYLFIIIIIMCLSSACLVHFYIVFRKKINVKCCWITVFVCPFFWEQAFSSSPRQRTYYPGWLSGGRIFHPQRRKTDGHVIDLSP